MKAIVINQKVVLIRHWLRWYRVMRGAEDWRKLKIAPYVKEKTVAQIAKDLQKKYPSKPLPDILDEQKADAIVAENIKNAKK